MVKLPKSIDDTAALLARADYVAERSLATALFLALKMERPLFLEGEAGVGKTEIAKVLASTLERRLVRLQCYEGLDISSAVYEWNYPRQMIEIRLAEASGKMHEASGQENKAAGRTSEAAGRMNEAAGGANEAAGRTNEAAGRTNEAAGQAARKKLSQDIFSEQFLIKRPLLQALESSDGAAPVLLIDELDRTDEPFEAYLLEVLSDFQVSIPELGTIKADKPPIVIITSNRTREIHDAVKRRCLYHWVDYPDAVRELDILRRKAPGAAERLSQEIVAFVQRLRKMDLFKLPGVAETIDWTKALVALDKLALDPDTVNDTLGALLKYQDDISRVRGSEAERLLSEVRAEIAAA